MKHLKKGRKFHRKKDQRKALIKNLASALVVEEKIRTTEAKAKEVRIFIEKKITKAKKDTVANRRFLGRYFAPAIVKKMMGELGPRYQSRNGGYTRIIKVGYRSGDAAPMAKIELV